MKKLQIRHQNSKLSGNLNQDQIKEYMELQQEVKNEEKTHVSKKDKLKEELSKLRNMK